MVGPRGCMKDDGQRKKKKSFLSGFEQLLTSLHAKCGLSLVRA